MSWWQRWRLVIVLGMTYVYFFQGSDPNQHSRLLLTRSLADGAGLTLGADHGLTIDKSEHAGEFYCDKAPGLSLLAVPIWKLTEWLDRASGVDTSIFYVDRARLHTITFVLCGLAGIWCSYSVRKAAERLGASAARAEGFALVFGLGTLVFPFSTALFGHVMSAALIAHAFQLLIKHQLSETLRPAELVQLGFCFALSIVTEYPSGLLVACLGLSYLHWEHRTSPKTLQQWTKHLLPLVSLAAPLLLLHSWYLWRAFGKPWALPYGFVFEPKFRIHHDKGLLGVQLPSPEGLIGVFLTPYRGLFFFCPVLLLSLWGISRWLRRKDFGTLPVTVMACLVCYSMFNTAYYAWDGGGSIGPRHIIPLLPMWTLGSVFVVGKWPERTHALLAVFSVSMMLIATAVLLHLGGDDVLFSSPMYSTVWPSWFRGELSLNTQSIFRAEPRADASYNLGTLFGLRPHLSVGLLVVMWFLMYPPRVLKALLFSIPSASARSEATP